MLKVLIADDHNLVRKGLKRLLLDTDWVGVVDEAKDSQEAISKVGSEDYNVVLLDISFRRSGSTPSNS
jgi:YesN/AraC family two-component response regulator